MANGKCRMHGGKTPTGFALPQTKHGRYSRDLPTRYHDRIGAAISDPDWLSLQADIVVNEARIGELMATLSSGGTVEQWEEVGFVYSALRDALDSEDMDEMDGAVTRLGSALRSNASDQKTWKRIEETQEHLRKLSETERKRLTDMQLLITREKALVLISAIMDVVRSHVSDRNVLAAIANDTRRLVGDARSGST